MEANTKLKVSHTLYPDGLRIDYDCVPVEQTSVIEEPIVTIDYLSNDNKVITVHSHINNKGKMVLNQDEAKLLLIEIWKFVNN